MIKCSSCGKELEDGSRFCDNCGTPVSVDTLSAQTVGADQTVTEPVVTQQTMAGQQTVTEQQTMTGQQIPIQPMQQPAGIFCTNCGAPIPVDSVFCQNCGASVTAGEAAGKAMGQGGKKKSRGLLAGIAAVCVIVVAVAAGWILSGGNKTSGADCIFYIKDKEVFYTGAGVQSPVQITDDLVRGENISNSDLADSVSYLGYYLQKSEDGKLVFFPDKVDENDDGFNLYYKELARINGEAKKIDSDIRGYLVNDAATMVTYMKEDDSLYSYNLKKSEKEKISGDVSWCDVSDDGKTVYYLNDEESLYIWRQGDGKEKIDSDVTGVCYKTEDSKTIYYMKEDSFYKRTEGEEKEKIASGVSNVLQVYDSGAVYYIKDNSDSQSIYDYVYDDMAEEDRNTTEPQWPDYPSRSNYYSDSAYNAAVAEYNKAREEYDRKYEEYMQKLDRDDMRAELEYDDSFILERYTLYYYDGKSEEKITDELLGMYNYNTAADSEVLVYVALDTGSLEKVKLSKFEYITDLRSQITSALRETANHYVAIKENVNPIETELGQNFIINAKGDSILFLSDVDVEKSRGDLYIIKVNDGKLSSPELYDDDVFVYNVYFADNEHICYFKDYDNGSGDLYIDQKMVDYDVYRYTMRYDTDNDRFYYLTDYNDSKEQGTLKVYANGKEEKIADDVSDYQIADDDVYYLRDYSQKSYRGELYQYSGKANTKIDDDVVGIMPVVIGRRYNYMSYRYSW